MRTHLCIAILVVAIVSVANSRSEANEALLNSLAEMCSPRSATHLVAKKKPLLVCFKAEKSCPTDLLKQIAAPRHHSPSGRATGCGVAALGV